MMKDGRENKPFWYVAWTSTLTGYEGRGFACLTRYQAQSWADHANKESPDIIHWVAYNTEAAAKEYQPNA